MLKLTLDTNVLVSAIIARGPSNKIAELVIEGKLAMALSLELLSELITVLSRNKFHLSPVRIEEVLKKVVDNAEIVMHVFPLDDFIPDSDDNKVLACAIASKSNYIVSGDSELLNLGIFRGIPIISPAEALRLVSSS